MHHEGFIEAVTVQLPCAAVLHVDHRRLAECRQQLMRTVGGEHQGAVRRARGTHAIAPGEELVKGSIGIPGLIKMQHLDTVAQLLLDQFGVVTQAVIGGVGHHRQFHFRWSPTGQGAGVDLGADRLRAEFAQGDRADDPQLVALRAQVQRDRAGHDDRMQHRLVAIAVYQHQVIAPHHGMPDDLVGGGRAVDHEERMVGAKVARGACLGFGQRPGVIEQRAQFGHRHRQVRAQGVFPEELMKRLPHRAFAIGHATAMTGGVPGIIGIGGVLHQRLEERRQQAIQVRACGAGDLARQKRHGVFEQIKNAAQLVELAHGIGGRVFQGDLLAQRKDRQVGCAQARQANQLHHVLQQMSVFPGAFGGNQHAGQTVMGSGHQPPLGVVHRRKNTEALLFQLPGDASNPVTGNGVGLDVTVHDQNGELQVFVHEHSYSGGFAQG